MLPNLGKREGVSESWWWAQRRRTAEDELNMRSVFEEGDLISVRSHPLCIH